MTTVEALGCPYHTQHKPDCLYCREAGAYEAAREDWVNRCPHCSNSDIRENEVRGYKWCSQCGKTNQ